MIIKVFATVEWTYVLTSFLGALAENKNITDRSKMFLSSAQSSDRFWDHTASYSMGTQGIFPGNEAAGA
jgi:hypothetical protein